MYNTNPQSVTTVIINTMNHTTKLYVRYNTTNPITTTNNNHNNKYNKSTTESQAINNTR